MSGTISNAKDQKISPNTLPDVSGALFNLFHTVQFIRVIKNIVNYQVTETYAPSYFHGVVQPFTPQQLAIRPEGQRDWRWFMIHALPGLKLSPDDVIYIDDLRYRVMALNDYAKYGYVEYQVIQDVQNRHTAPPLPTNELNKFLGTVAIDGTLTSTVDISGGAVGDAGAAIWQLYKDGVRIHAQIQIIDSDHVKITVEEAGVYHLVGVE